jgi:ubiquinone/menaquinone biosynthesis C-methylase UbiE
MLTVDYQLLGLRAGDRVLDLGCGAGRHAFEALRRGARVTAFDYDEAELKDVGAMATAMDEAGDLPAAARSGCARGDATRLPFPDATFDRIIAAEVLEHIDDDFGAIRELVRVLRPGGTIAATVPSFLPERICWALTDEYHAPFVPGGHVRIYTTAELRNKLGTAGAVPYAKRKEHGIHAPYWWLKCAVGPTHDDHPLVRAYHQVLCWDIGGAQPWSKLTRAADAVLTPIVGKSMVIYARKTEATTP